MIDTDLSPDLTATTDLPTVTGYLGGSPWAPPGAPLATVDDPVTGELCTRYPVATAAHVALAVERAAAAAARWALTAPAERAAALSRAAEAVQASAEELARSTTRETGRPLTESRGSVAAAVGTLRQYAELGQLHGGRVLAGSPDATDLVVRRPRGVVAVVTPWNDPVPVAAGLVSAALVTGNAVVHKPSERTPATGALLGGLLATALPPDVLVVVPGDATTGAALSEHPGADLVAHVGSTASGRRIAAATAARGAAALLENGGKDPLVVDRDVDPEWAAEQAALGAFANAGQLCTSVERIYVHADVADAFVAALVRRAQAHVLGAGTDERATMGPLIDRRHREHVHAHVREALERGARALTGGAVPDGPGSFYPPTVLVDVDDDMTVMREETFGPVAPVRVVPSFEDGIALAASSSYGLAATVLTGDPAHIRTATRLPVGTVKVNAVFGGAPGGAAHPRRGSGQGFGYGPELLDEMTYATAVHIEDPVTRT